MTKKKPIYNTATNPIERKYNIVKTYPEFIHNQLPDYRPFLATFTFNNSNRELPITCYHDYFKFFYRKLCQQLINRKSNHKKPTLILIPEKSYQCVEDHMYSCIHFHGFLLIHQETLHKFNKKCVIYKYNISNQILLHPKLTSPYPLQAKMNDKIKLLEKDNVDVHIPATIKETMKFASYSCKSFIDSDFTDTDMMIFSRPPVT